MRYRIYQNNIILGTFSDRPAFHKAYSGNNPNSSLPGDTIILNNEKLIIKEHNQYPSSNSTENEFHETENEWFADIIVQPKPHKLHYWIRHKDGYLFCETCNKRK